jgi:hypothetical protein
MVDSRYYETFYGIYTTDWTETCCGVSLTGTTHFLLNKNYISDAASTVSASRWGSSATIFLYPHNIKKDFVVEGTIEGQITFTSDLVGARSYVSDYRVSLVKISDCSVTVLATTGVVSINKNISYDIGYHVGDDVVCPFWIELYNNPKHITENEKLGVKVEWDINNSSTVTAAMMHDNDPNYEDFKIIIPMLLG